MNSIGKVVNYLVLILGLVMIAYYLALGITVRFGQSLQILWLIAGLLCVTRFGVWTWIDHSHISVPRLPLWILRGILLAGLLFFFTVEGIILRVGMIEAPQGLDCIVVLGARVNGSEPSGALRNRTERARVYLEANPDAIAILSGGRGKGEDISEAECMRRMLTQAGIDPARLTLEEKSTDTSENLLYSRELIPAGARVGLVSNDFHLFRARALARGLSWEVVGVPVATSFISFPHYMMREFVGVVYDSLRGNLKF